MEALLNVDGHTTHKRPCVHSVHMETLLNGDGRTRSVAWKKKIYFLFPESIFIIKSR